MIEILVVVAIVGVISFIFSTLTVNQIRAAKAVTQKLEMNDLKQTLMTALSNSANCECLLNPLKNLTDAAGLRFNASQINLGSVPPVFGSMSLTTINSACDSVTGAPILPIVSVNSPLPGTTTGLRVTNISVGNIRPFNPTLNQFIGNFQVEFDPETTIGSVAPVTAQVNFSATGVAGMVSVVACGGASSTTLTEQSVCEDTLGFVYDASRTPPCMLGGAASRNLCLGFNGAVDPTGTLCTLSLTIPGTNPPFSFPCIVPLNPNASNTQQTLYALMSLSLSPEFLGAEKFNQKVRKILLQAQSQGLAKRLFELVGVDPSSKKEVARFLRTKDFANDEFTDRVMQDLELGNRQAQILLTSVAMKMAGELR